jgi:dolichyl-phosphate-mannose-protein mannosyltransferase
MGMEIKNKLYRFYKWEHFWLVVIVVSTLIMHFAVITQPSQPFFDEIYYVNDARHIIADGGTWRPEHPPLGKLLIVADDLIFTGFRSPQQDTGTTLQKSINPGQTIITVSDASIFKVNTTICIDSETMYIESINPSVNQMSVKRGYGSNAAAHDALQKIYVFNDTPWGWRFFPILCGTAAIAMFYFLCLRLGMSKNATIIATFLLAFENLTFVQNGMAMLDVFFLTFMMAAFLLYACRRYISSGVAIGLAGLAKLNGLLALPTVAFHWFFTSKLRYRWVLLIPIVAIIILVFFNILIWWALVIPVVVIIALVFYWIYTRKEWALVISIMAVVAFLVLMILCDWAITRNFSMVTDPINRIKEMTQGTAALTFHDYPNSGATYPWTWLYNYKVPLYYNMPHWYGAVSFSVWALIIPTFIYMIWRAFKKDNAALFGVGWFTCVFLIWIPATLITDRLTYPFYIYASIGAICLGLGIALNRMLEFWHSDAKKVWRVTVLTVFIVIIAAHVLSFLILSPLIPINWADLAHLYN